MVTRELKAQDWCSQRQNEEFQAGYHQDRFSGMVSGRWQVQNTTPHVGGASMNEIMFLNTHVSMSDEMGRLWHGRLPQADLILGMPSPPSTSLVPWSSLASWKRNFIDVPVSDGPTVQTLGAAMPVKFTSCDHSDIFPTRAFLVFKAYQSSAFLFRLSTSESRFVFRFL